MFFQATLGKFLHQIETRTLEEIDDVCVLKQSAEWFERKWGYIRGFSGLGFREKQFEEARKEIYIVLYSKQPIGMFRLKDFALAGDVRAKELVFFYVDENFRGMGVGGRMIKIAKETCCKKNVEMIVLETTSPYLNKFYEKYGARTVCDGQLLGHPTTVMRI